jgi:hypothetical protein
MPSPSGARTRGSKQVVSVEVNLTVTSPDNLRHIEFGLEKDTASGSVTWTIDFKFQQRADVNATFVTLVSLHIKVKSKYNDSAAATKQEGLSPAQQEHLLGPATVAAQGLAAGTVPEASASRVVENTLAKH